MLQAIIITSETECNSVYINFVSDRSRAIPAHSIITTTFSIKWVAYHTCCVSWKFWVRFSAQRSAICGISWSSSVPTEEDYAAVSTYFYLESIRFESQPVYWEPLIMFSWSYAVPRGELLDSTLKWVTTSSSKTCHNHHSLWFSYFVRHCTIFYLK